LRLLIEKLIYGGDGLARLPADERGPGKAVFLPFVLPGEEVEAALTEERPGFVRAQAEGILQASPLRIEPPCPYFRRCGGCHYQHTSYENQLAIKAAILKENFRRIAKLELESELTIHPSPPWNYRNRTRLRIQDTPEFALGYYRFGSHELLPVEQCPISSPLINRAIAALWQLGRARQLTSGIQEAELFATAADTELLMELYCPPGVTPSTPTLIEILREPVPELVGIAAYQQAPKGAVEPKRIGASGKTELSYQAKQASYRVSAGAFFQVNRYLADELVEIVAGGRSGETAWDLYAGVGLFSAALSRSFAQVIAVESSQTAYADLAYNSPANVRTVRALTDHYLKNLPSEQRPDLVVVDPPRSGLGESVVRALAASGAHRITYVSCDPATLPRDLVGLLRSGYRIEQAHLVDLFPQTFHLESVFVLAQM
jgi:23S rRNA (uracil1939-C5)-methyltransferase